jgi:hypothetical protein
MEFKNDKEQAVEINFQNFATKARPGDIPWDRAVESTRHEDCQSLAHLLRFHCYRLALS